MNVRYKRLARYTWSLLSILTLGVLAQAALFRYIASHN